MNENWVYLSRVYLELWLDDIDEFPVVATENQKIENKVEEDNIEEEEIVV